MPGVLELVPARIAILWDIDRDLALDALPVAVVVGGAEPDEVTRINKIHEKDVIHDEKSPKR
jgi:hypothetical protein